MIFFYCLFYKTAKYKIFSEQFAIIKNKIKTDKTFGKKIPKNIIQNLKLTIKKNRRNISDLKKALCDYWNCNNDPNDSKHNIIPINRKRNRVQFQ